MDPSPSSWTTVSPSGLRVDLVGQEDAKRQAESEAVAREYRKVLDLRTHQRTYSPDYVNSRPSSMREKLRVTPEEQELALFHYAATASIPRTVELSGVSAAKVRAIVYAPDLRPELDALREAMRISVLGKIEETQMILLDALQSPTKLDSATLGQISDVLHQVSEVHTALRASLRTETPFGEAVDPTAVFTGDELEYMAFLRRRLSPSAPTGPSAVPSTTTGPAFPSGAAVDLPFEVQPGEAIEPDFVVSGADRDQDVGPSAFDPAGPPGGDT